MGGYAKIFTRILDSTIWMEDDETRLLWITILAMADQDGIVSASLPGLAARARISIELCEAALEKFQGPDKYSINQEDEGRRIRKTDGGWFLINHAKYRSLMSYEDLKAKAADRQRDRRDRVNSGLDASIKAQEYKCGCCFEPFRTPFSLYVVMDHNHQTGVYRAAICQSCNKIVGQLENDKTVLSPKSVVCRAYVERHSSPKSQTVTANHANHDNISEAKADSEAKAVSQKRFVPPSLEEVDSYIQSKSSKVDPVKFWNHYEANGWLVGRNKMKNWQAAVATWEGNSTSLFGGNGNGRISESNSERRKRKNEEAANAYLAQNSSAMR